MRARVTIMVLITTVSVLLLPAVAHACPVCFGGAEGPMAEGMNNGIVFLLGVIGAVQFGFAALFVGIWRRGRRRRRLRQEVAVVDGGVR